MKNLKHALPPLRVNEVSGFHAGHPLLSPLLGVCPGEGGSTIRVASTESGPILNLLENPEYRASLREHGIGKVTWVGPNQFHLLNINEADALEKAA